MAGSLERIARLQRLPASIAAQSSKYQCDGNDKHDACGNHQNLEGVIAWKVMVRTLHALHGQDCTPCDNKHPFIFWLLIGVGMRAVAFRIESFQANVWRLTSYCCASERPTT